MRQGLFKMKLKKIITILLFILVTSCGLQVIQETTPATTGGSTPLPGNCQGDPPSGLVYNELGSGTDLDPYLIYSAQQLASIASDSSALAFSYEQCADIDLSSFYSAGGAQFSLGGDFPSSSPFTGNYNGNNYKISNFVFNDPAREGAGIFSTVDGSLIQNLVLENISITALTGIGGLVGFMQNATVQNIIAETYIVGDPTGSLVGGVIGGINGPTTIEEVTHRGSVIGGSFVAGVLGMSADALFNPSTGQKMINNISSSANITANSGAAGAIGAINDAIIRNSFATGNINIDGVTAGGGGGFIGAIENTLIEDCYSTGNIDANTNTTAIGGDPPESGGFVVAVLAPSIIRRSYAIGDVISKGQAGGFIASIVDQVLIEDSYSSGRVECVDIGGSDCQAGGFVGGAINGFFGSSGGDIEFRRNFSSGNVISNGNSGGGFVGVSNTLINNIIYSDNFSTGNVQGVDRIGGFAGSVGDNSSFQNNYSAGDVTGINEVGGFVGVIGGVGVSITQSFTFAQAVSYTAFGGTFFGASSGATLTGAYYYSGGGYSCPGCATNGIGEANMASFYTPNNAPLNYTWDFSSVWGLNGAALPGLQLIP